MFKYDGGFILMPTIEHFELPADDPKRATEFYNVFLWKHLNTFDITNLPNAFTQMLKEK